MVQPRSRRRLTGPFALGATHCYKGGSATNLVTNRQASTVVAPAIRSAMGGHASVLAGSAAHIADSLGSSLSTSQFWTYAAIVSFDTISSAQALATMAAVAGSTTYDRSLLLTNTGVFGAYLFDGAQRAINGTTVIERWRPYAVVVAATNALLSVYVNGKLEGSVVTTSAGFAYGSGVSLVLGYGGGGTSSGALDQGGSFLLSSSANLSYFQRVVGEAWPIGKVEAWSGNALRAIGQPLGRKIFGVSAAFQAAWASGANSVIQSGARAA